MYAMILGQTSIKPKMTKMAKMAIVPKERGGEASRALHIFARRPRPTW